MEISTATKEKYSRPATAENQPRSEWEEQLDNFLKQLNPGRVSDGFAPYTHARLGRILKKAGVNDASGAYILYRKCEGGHSFSRLFAYLTSAKV
jgi:hypothetical protein